MASRGVHIILIELRRERARTFVTNGPSDSKPRGIPALYGALGTGLERLPAAASRNCKR